MSRSNLQGSRSHWSFKMQVTQVIRSFCSVLSVAPPLVAESLDTWHTYNTRGKLFAHHFRVERAKVKVTRVVQMLVYAALNSSTHAPQRKPMRRRWVGHHYQVKVQGHTDRCKFCHVYSIGVCLFNRFIVRPLRGSMPTWLAFGS